MKVDGSWCVAPSEMEQMANSYFKEVFTKHPTLDPNVLLDSIAPKVSPEMNEAMCQDYTEEEISNALFQIGQVLSTELGCSQG